MRVGPLRWENLIEQALQIADAARLEFKGGQGRGGGRTKEREDAILHPALGDRLRHLLGKVLNIGIAAGGKGYRMRVNAHGDIILVALRNPDLRTNRICSTRLANKMLYEYP